LTGVFLALLLFAAAAEPPTAESARPTFCIEWIRQSREGYERVTLFADRTVVWKTSGGSDGKVRRKQLAPEELEFYCAFFARKEFWDLPEDLRTGLTGEFAAQSAVTLARADGLRKRVRFDELSALTADAAALRSALDGLKGIFLAPMAPASRFSPDVLPPGTLLKRFDGAVFRVVRVEKEKGVVEVAGVREPYSQFFKIEELRFQFSPPE